MAQMLSRGPVSGTAAGRGRKRKPFLLDLYSTAVGKKYVMAITGIIGIGFVIFHMIGNLKMYLGLIDHDGERVYDIDVYGEFLRELLVPILPRTYFLWILRLVLIGAAGPARPRRLLAHDPQPPGPSGEVPVGPRLPGRQLRQPHDALDRHHRAAVPVLAPRRLHVGLVQPRLRPRRGLPQRRRQPLPGAGGDPLHRRQHRPRHPPLPRHVEPVPVDGLEQPALQQVAARPRDRHRRRSSWSATSRSRSPCSPASSSIRR